jgi:flagellar motor switch/type III secretory pathway protein FliN
MLARIRPALLGLDVRLRGPRLLARDLLRLAEGDVLAFDFPVDRPVDGLLNGKLRFGGRIIQTGRKRGFLLETVPASPGAADKEKGL